MVEIKITGDSALEALKDLNNLANSFKSIEKEVAKEAKAAEAKKEEPKKEEPKKETAKEAKKEGTKKEEVAKEAKAAEAKKEEPKKEAAEAKSFTLEEVRAKAVELQRAKRMDFVKQVLKAVGAPKLSEIDPSKYAYVMNCFEHGEINVKDDEVSF